CALPICPRRRSVRLPARRRRGGPAAGQWPGGTGAGRLGCGGGRGLPSFFLGAVRWQVAALALFQGVLAGLKLEFAAQQAAGVVRHPAQPLFEGGVRGVPGGDVGGDPLAALLLGGLVAGGSVSLWAVRRGRCPLPPALVGVWL